MTPQFRLTQPAIQDIETRSKPLAWNASPTALPLEVDWQSHFEVFPSRTWEQVTRND